MICPNCNKKNNNNKIVCFNCGEPLNNNQKKSLSNNNNKKIIIATTLLAIVIGTIVIFFTLVINNESEKKELQNQNNNIENNSPDPRLEKEFLFNIEEIYNIENYGVVVTGIVSRGVAKVGDTVDIVGIDNNIKTATITAIERFQQSQNEAIAGQPYSIALKGIKSSEITKGQVLAKPNSIKAYTEFNADVEFYTEEKGGKSTPILSSYTPQIYFGIVGLSGQMKFPDNKHKITPGEKVTIGIKLVKPIALETGFEFKIRENGKVIGKGIVKEILK